MEGERDLLSFSSVPGANRLLGLADHPPWSQGGRHRLGKARTPKKFGACASFTLVSGEQGIVKIPDGWTSDRSVDEFARAGVVAITALQALRVGDLPCNASGGQATGGKVFINGGSGGVGTFTVLMAKHCFGCETVVLWQ